MNLEERFWSKVNILGEDDCWEWQASFWKVGYGCFSYFGKKIGSNRMTWFLTYGEFPELWVLHKCDNRSCCNPKHLFLGTNQDNVKDMLSKNRQAHLKGEQNGLSKLKNKDIISIKKLYESGKYTHQQLSNKFNVSRVNITNIINNKAWAHI